VWAETCKLQLCLHGSSCACTTAIPYPIRHAHSVQVAGTITCCYAVTVIVQRNDDFTAVASATAALVTEVHGACRHSCRGSSVKL
jgi:hypothetical protein